MKQMKKGDILENIVVKTMAAEGKCVARIDNLVIFLEGGAPGDTVDVMLTKIKSSFLEGRVVNVKSFSPHRAEPFCVHFGVCGGCSWQHIEYEHQLEYKQQQAVDHLERIGGLELPPVNTIVGSRNTKYYRNKLDYTFSARRWLTKAEFAARKEAENSSISPIPYEVALGYHIPRKFDLIFDVTTCWLQPEPSNGIRLAVREEAIKNNIPFFDLRTQIGFLRTLTIRTANTGEVMIILQVTADKMDWTEIILKRLQQDFSQITSFQFVINSKKNDTFSDLNIECWKGNPYITEMMPKPDGKGPLEFRVGPKSFYQTNSQQAYELYMIAWRMADLQGDEVVYDLYTGTGTIANFVAAHARKVIGLEYVAASIEDAKLNSRVNNVLNTEFFSGDIKDLLNPAFLSQHGKPDVVITDPPRAGMHENVCRMLLQAEPEKIVYVSCNPATQARDLKILAEKYVITEVQPVDMFPHTVHVENVVKLVRK
jgi:23S rRNA (uracil1939-C5)-methyltransferase